MITTNNILFVGGPGRSGTSFVADRLGQHPDICTFKNVELKLFTEKNGLLDLYHALVLSYSPNRATVAVDQFSRFFEALVDGRYGQQALTTFAPRDQWMALLHTLLNRVCQNGHAAWLESDQFYQAACSFLLQITRIATTVKDGSTSPSVFLEKTPHALLAPDFLNNIAPGCRFLHVMRDPRSIAFSVRSMPWGPKRLEACCSWVANYCAAWLHAQTTIARSGATVECIQIESIAASPELWSERVCTHLNVKPARKLFDSAEVQILNGWADKCSDGDMEVLDRNLTGWAAHFGYGRDKIGTIQATQHASYAA